jgi:hypothetical protein
VTGSAGIRLDPQRLKIPINRDLPQCKMRSLS